MKGKGGRQEWEFLFFFLSILIVLFCFVWTYTLLTPPKNGERMQVMRSNKVNLKFSATNWMALRQWILDKDSEPIIAGAYLLAWE